MNPLVPLDPVDRFREYRRLLALDLEALDVMLLPGADAMWSAWAAFDAPEAADVVDGWRCLRERLGQARDTRSKLLEQADAMLARLDATAP